MELKMFSMRDAKSGVFHTPYFKSTHGEAERDFKRACNDPKTMLNQFPEDFDLWYLGTYDDNTGLMKQLSTPEHVMKAVQCVEQQEINP